MTYDLNNHGFLAQFRVPDVFFFFFVEQAINPSTKQLVIPITFIPLLHQSAYLARPAVIVIHRVQNKVRLLMIFHPGFVKEPSCTMQTR